MRRFVMLASVVLGAACSRGASPTSSGGDPQFTVTVTPSAAAVFTGDTTTLNFTVTNRGPGALYIAPGTCNTDFRLVGVTSGAVYYPGEPAVCTLTAIAPFNLAVGATYQYSVWTTGRMRPGSAVGTVATIVPGVYTVQSYFNTMIGGDVIGRGTTNTNATITFR
jgi:hypothetical protein